jgi:hypothetical protein
VDTNPALQLQKRRQLFIRTHNESVSFVAVCVNDPDCAALLLFAS